MSASITGQSTMQEVLDAFPSAQRALFKKYHMGGCNSCGYGPQEKLEDVARNHNIQDVGEVLAFLHESAESDAKLIISPQALKTALSSPNSPRLFDVRMPQEFELASIKGGEPFTRELNMQMGNWDLATPMVFYCHTGVRSLDAASYFAGHGFTNVKSLDGGIDRWSIEIDKAVPRYELKMGRMRGQAEVRPLSDSLPH